MKIIFCDNNDDNLNSYKNFIERYESPYVDASYTDKISSLFEYCRVQSPDMVVTEIFPNKQKVCNQNGTYNQEFYDGLDAIQKIKSESDKDIYCVVATQNRDVEYVIKALNCGANKYLEKSIEYDVLYEVLKTQEEKLFSEIALEDAWSLNDESKALEICMCINEMVTAYSSRDVLAFASRFHLWKKYSVTINPHFFLRYFGFCETDIKRQLEIIEEKLTELFCLTNDAGISRKIIKYVDDNLFRPQMSLDFVASTFSCSPTTISMFFKNVVNTNFSKYVQEHRMSKAKKLLLTTDKSVKEIALECGYSYTNYFIKRFVQKEGMTPSYWRKAK